MTATLARRSVPLVPDLPGAACEGRDVNAFFQAEYERTPVAVQRITLAALTFCLKCPVRRRCAEEAGEYGLWGGWLRRGPSKPINLLKEWTR